MAKILRNWKGGGACLPMCVKFDEVDANGDDQYNWFAPTELVKLKRKK